MAYYTIQARKSKAGVKYRCIVRFSRGNSQEGSKSKTFPKKAEATAWGKREVAAIEKNGTVGFSYNATLRDLLSKYLEDQHVSCSRTKRFSLRLVSDCDIASIRLDNLSAQDVVKFAKDRNGGGASPATVAVDVSNVRAVLKSARALYGLDVDETAIRDAMPVLQSLKLVGKPQKRTRRPTSEELDRLRQGLQERQQKSLAHIPFVDILDFSILSCMRIGEVCKILWEDLDVKNKSVIVRDRKDPRKKAGNHMLVPLLGGSLDIILRQVKDEDPRIFPFNPTSVTAGFQRVRRKLEIKDLRYHDLRREGASRLFEKGYTVDQVAQVTGHRDLNMLWQVYTNLSPDRLPDYFDND